LVVKKRLKRIGTPLTGPRAVKRPVTRKRAKLALSNSMAERTTQEDNPIAGRGTSKKGLIPASVEAGKERQADPQPTGEHSGEKDLPSVRSKTPAKPSPVQALDSSLHNVGNEELNTSVPKTYSRKEAKKLIKQAKAELKKYVLPWKTPSPAKNKRKEENSSLLTPHSEKDSGLDSRQASTSSRVIATAKAQSIDGSAPVSARRGILRQKTGQEMTIPDPNRRLTRSQAAELKTRTSAVEPIMRTEDSKPDKSEPTRESDGLLTQKPSSEPSAESKESTTRSGRESKAPGYMSKHYVMPITLCED